MSCYQTHEMDMRNSGRKSKGWDTWKFGERRERVPSVTRRLSPWRHDGPSKQTQFHVQTIDPIRIHGEKIFTTSVWKEDRHISFLSAWLRRCVNALCAPQLTHIFSRTFNFGKQLIPLLTSPCPHWKLLRTLEKEELSISLKNISTAGCSSSSSA